MDGHVYRINVIKTGMVDIGQEKRVFWKLKCAIFFKQIEGHENKPIRRLMT